VTSLRTSLVWTLFLISGANLAYGAQPLTSWMDDRYGAPVKANASDCFATIYDYNEVTQVNGWDCAADDGRLTWIEVARPERVNRDLLITARKAITIPGRTNASGKKAPDVESYEVGNPKQAEFAVIFVHGAGGDEKLGAMDTNMGGNFNRLMNLIVRNNGVYYTPTVDFNDGGEGIQTILEKLQKDNPGIKVILACGSAGAATCNAVANRVDSVPYLAGWMLTGGAGGLENITTSEAYKKSVPMIIAHGSRDGVDSYIDNFKKMRKRPDGTNYPVWMQVYNDGGHGTPIRMIDWKASLNWIFAQNETKQSQPGCPPPNPSAATPAITDLSSSAQAAASRVGAVTCDQFFNYPFIKTRDPSVSYASTVKSTCIAAKKEEIPGEDLHIVTPK